MRYLYMDNFRGFSDTVVPLRQTNFLVGENSTGKSSFLSLLSLANYSNFWFYPNFSFYEETEFNSFDDIVSKSSHDRLSFRVGVFNVVKNRAGRFDLTLNIHEFNNQKDRPALLRHAHLKENKLVALLFDRVKTKYQISRVESSFSTEEDAVRMFRKIAGSLKKEQQELKTFPREFPQTPPLPLSTEHWSWPPYQ